MTALQAIRCTLRPAVARSLVPSAGAQSHPSWRTRACFLHLAARSRAATPGLADAAGGGDKAAANEQKWDVYREEEQSAIAPSSMWKLRIDHKFSEQDLERFAVERSVFRADPRLHEALPRSTPSETPMDLDWHSTLIGTLGILRLGDYFTEPFRDLVVERLTEQGDLMEHFQIPRLLDQDANKPLHSQAVPTEGMYARVRLQVYWLALHIWLVHSKQYAVQETEGIFGSALCALITRRLFEWSWNQVRGWLHEADVPVMSLTDEVQDMQEYVFGFCLALDQAFKDEAPSGTASALSLDESSLEEGRHGIAPLVKHVLWANVYSGVCSKDASHLDELTTYVLQQRALLESMDRGDYFCCRWTWAEFVKSDSVEG